MFGTLNPHRCSLPEVGRERHGRLYCGLCRTLGDDHGQLSRGLLSHDAVLVATVADGLQLVAAADAETRCPILPVVHRPTLAPDSPPLRFAAAVQILLADQYVADRAMDGKRLARWARPLGQRTVAGARQILDELGTNLDGLEGFEHRQLAVELDEDPGPRMAAAPTRDALRQVFAALGKLPGGVALDGNGQARLAQLGSAIGDIVYLVDALEDLPRDLAQGEFNPCLVGEAGALVVSPSRVVEACVALDEAFGLAALAVTELPWQRNAAVVQSAVVTEQRAKADQAMVAARQLAGLPVEARACAVRCAPAPGPFKVLEQGMLAAAALLMVWASTTGVALAEKGTKGKGPDAKDTGLPPEVEPPVEEISFDAIWAALDALREAAVAALKGLADAIVCCASGPGLLDKAWRSCQGVLEGCCVASANALTGCCGGVQECNSCMGDVGGCCNGCAGCQRDCGGCCSGGKDCGGCCDVCGGCGKSGGGGDCHACQGCCKAGGGGDCHACQGCCKGGGGGGCCCH